ncbi:intercellular adhesion molecule 5-like [Spea bombifrons]|uniref:intercellular adhesion molecule 5-like n=1 Tax=Spea bombifrons TaxID=233779 RepID=UPI002349FCB9|nr:intercellular adhesion molecule 5-like [Spea bombifrons]
MGFRILWLLVLHICWISPKGASSCDVNVAEQQLFAERNEFVLLNCTSACSPLHWKSPLLKDNRTEGDGWISVMVKAELKKEKAYCNYVYPNATLITKAVQVIGYAFPSGVAIDMPDLLKEGALYDVTCSVYGVAPIDSVTVSLTRDGQVRQEKRFDNDSRQGMVNETVTFQFMARRSDNLKDFSCEATLELGTFLTHTVSSNNVTARTFSLPNNMEIISKVWIETGATAEVKCVAPKTFPPENVTMEMRFNFDPLSLDTIVRPDGTVEGRSTLPLSNVPTGKNELVCEAEVFGFARNSSFEVNIYEHPAIAYEVSKDGIGLGENITAFCNVTNANKEVYIIRVLESGQVVCEDDRFGRLACDITAGRRLPEMIVTCRAYLIENENVTEEESRKVSVYYPPQFTDNLCPNNVIWVEGKTTHLPCEAEGNPLPSVTCNLPDNITRKHSGAYTCEATNGHGKVEKSINLIVQYKPSPPVVTVAPSAEIRNGYPFNLTCESDALPASEYRWSLPPDAVVISSSDNSSITITHSTSSHGGEYRCEVSNKHGSATASVNVQITDNTWLIALIVSVVAAAVLLSAGLVFYWLWRKGKIGFYRVESAPCKSDSANEMTELSNGHQLQS